MLDNNHNNYSCEFAAEMISYVYGEINARAKSDFERHLTSCSNCTEEIAGFGLVRSSISDWRNEFSTVETPAFVLPFEKEQILFETVSVSTEKSSWLGELHKIFPITPAWAATAFAALAICVGLTILVVNFSGDLNRNEIAVKEVNKNVLPAVSATVEKKVKQTNETDSNESAKENVSDNPANQQDYKEKNSGSDSGFPVQTNLSVSKDSFVKVSTNSRKTSNDYKPSPNSIDLTTEKTSETYKENKKTVPVKSQKALKLVEEDETEDDSVRLADLFDEIDTK